jgi:hypothetical protein
MKRSVLGLAAAAVGVCPAASAGPWPATDGAVGIVSAFLTDAGNDGPAAGVEAYGEQPLGARHGVVLSGWVDERDTGHEGRGELTLGLKRSTGARFGPAAYSLQAGPSARLTPEAGCTALGAEVRGSAGISGLGSNRGVFATADIAARPGFGGCSALRSEIAVGYWRHPGQTLWLGQAFLDHPRDEAQVWKLQVSRVGLGQDRRGWQVGARLRLDGDRPEYSLALGRWQLGGSPRNAAH